MKRYNYKTRKLEVKSIIIAAMGILIIILLLLLLLPKVTTSLRAEGFTEGVQMCQTQILTKIVDDLNTQKFTAIQIGDQTIQLGIMDVKEIEPPAPE